MSTEKLDYSDLYKFTVSVGVVLIFLALLIPWLFLSASFDVTLTASDVQGLTPAGQLLVGYRQSTAAWFLQHSWGLSAGIGVVGLAFVGVGLYRWYFRQGELDRLQQYQVEIAARQIKPLTPQEASQKVIEEMGLPSLGIPLQDPSLNYQILAKNLFMKAMVVERLKQAAKEKGLKVWANLAVGGSQCDVLVKQRRPGGETTWIIEVRCIPKTPTVHWAAEETGRLLLLQQSYSNKNSIRATAVLCVFTPDGCPPIEKNEGFRLSDSLENLRDQLRVLYLDEKILPAWTAGQCCQAILPGAG
jgi:hypothetical protein